MQLVFFITFLCILSVNAWVAIIRHDPNISSHGGYCYTDSNDIGALQKNEVVRIKGQCATATCHNNHDIGLTGCGVVSVAPPCYVVDGDLSKPFPDCCFDIKCPEKQNEAKTLNSI